MPLTPQDVHSKVFGPTRFRRGYDEAEVDAFLDEVQAELTRLHREIDALRGQLGSGGSTRTDTAPGAVDPSATSASETEATAASTSGLSMDKDLDVASAVDVAKGDGSGDLEQRVARTLVLAQRAADEALRDAETHAEQLRAATAAEAEQIRAAAEAEAERVRAEVAEAVARERAAIESERGSAHDDVEQLRAFEREYRLRLRAYLELQLRELDGAGAGQVENGPAPALPADAVDDTAPGGAPDGQVPLSAGGPAYPTERPVPAAQGYAGTYAPTPATAAPTASDPHAADSAVGGVSRRAAGDEEAHEPPA